MGWMGVLREGAMGRRLGWTGVMGAWLLALGLSSGVAGEVAPDGADAAAAEVGVAEVGAAIAAHDHVRCLASRSAEAAEAACRASLEAFRVEHGGRDAAQGGGEAGRIGTGADRSGTRAGPDPGFGYRETVILRAPLAG